MPKLTFKDEFEEEIKDVKQIEIGKIVKIPIDKIEIGENIRNVMEDDENFLIQLGESIKEQGQIEPCIVYQQGDRYILKAGSRRYKACTLVDIDTLDCIIDKQFDNEIDRIIYQATENEHRSDMSSRERERYMARLNELGLSNQDIAKSLHKSKGWVSAALTAYETVKNNEDIFNGFEREPSTRTAWDYSKLSNIAKKEVDENIKKAKETNQKTDLKKEIEKAKQKEEETKKTQEDNIEINKVFGIDFDIEEDPQEKDTFGFTAKDTTEVSDEITYGIHFTFILDDKNKTFKFKSDKNNFDTDVEKYMIRMLENYYLDKGYRID